MNRKRRILHLDTEKGFRGGEQQVLNLMLGLKDDFEQAIVVREGHALESKMNEAGFQTIPVSTSKPMIFSGSASLKKSVLKFQPDIIHGHTGNSHTIAWRLLRKMAPVVVTRRVDFDLKKNFISRKKYQHVGTHYVAISNAIRDILIRGGVQDSQISVIPSGIDPERFTGSGPFPDEAARSEWREKCGAGDQTIVYATVGSYVDHKDPLNLVLAASELKKAVLDFRILLIGEGELRPALEDKIRELGLEKTVFLTGWQEDVSKPLSAADVFVMPSKLEGLCTSLLDAQALGLPCVVTSAGGMPDIVIDGKTGLLAEAENPVSLAVKMQEILVNEDRKIAMISEGRQRIQELFTIDAMTRSYKTLYQEILEKGGY